MFYLPQFLHYPAQCLTQNAQNNVGRMDGWMGTVGLTKSCLQTAQPLASRGIGQDCKNWINANSHLSFEELIRPFVFKYSRCYSDFTCICLPQCRWYEDGCNDILYVITYKMYGFESNFYLHNFWRLLLFFVNTSWIPHLPFPSQR